MRHFTRPEDEACLRRLGEMLTEGALEQAHLWPRVALTETDSAIEAAGRDLLHTARFLVAVGDARHLSTLSPREHQRAHLAARTGHRLAREARQLLEGLSVGEPAS